MSSNKPVEVVSVGHILKEQVIYPEKEIGPVLGSPAAYSAVASSRLGVNTGIMTKVGENMPKDLLQVFGEAGVNQEGLRQLEGEKTTVNQLIYNEAGEKHLNFLQKAPDLLPKDRPKSYQKAKLFYVCPIDFEVPLRTVEKLDGLGGDLMVDLGGYGGATSSTHQMGDSKKLEDLKQLISQFDIVKISLEDSRLIFGKDKQNLPNEVAERFLQWGADISLITLGEKGGLVVTLDEKENVPSYTDSPKDQTGAGDTFGAGFIAEYLNDKSPVESTHFASATASLVIEESGGVRAERMPRYEEVKKRLSSRAQI